MANPESVKVVEVCRVAPQPSASAREDMSLPLTFFDLLWLRFEPFQRLFFYELASDTTVFFDSILPKLKTSLSLTLQHFQPLAGNLTWPQDSTKPTLSYVKGHSVSLTVAQYHSDATDHDHFHHLSSKDFLDAKEYHPFVPQLDASHDRAAALAVQITVFPNSGFSIGTAMHHAVLDGKTLSLFFKMWAHVCRHDHQQLASTSSCLFKDGLKPCFSDRKLIQDPKGLTEIYSNQWLNMEGPNNRSLMTRQLSKVPPCSIRSTFQFTQASIQKLRRHVKNVLNSDEVRLSAFSLTCAYTWLCLVKSEEIKCDKVGVFICVDCRSRFYPPLSPAYFGNCVSGGTAVAETQGLLGKDGLIVAVNAIIEALKRLLNEGVLFDGAENWISTICDLMGDGDLKSDDTKIFSIAGSPQFEIYETDFGWGRPKRTEVVTIDKTGAILFSDSKNGGGGIEVGLVLKEENMRVFASLFAKGLEDI